ncbi:hypothetical protein I3842_01G124300 [Carya illinoinensis]|uniref:Uncharacterized protein n=1 Tax=Carya illinoinensis TaxID=32201 RepID=A0A922G2X3_CARIL|nr:hypothetical protein I3842_01G124300 [Carya illinoinensis]
MDGDALSAYIKAFDEKLDGLTPINAEDHCIFKVHEQLLKVNEKAYKPMLLAIGPYNDHSKVGQGLMEEHKLWYLKQMRETRNDRKLEGRARKCYVECISQNKDEFVEMMLLDGCFIIELFRKWDGSSPRDGHDPIFELDWMLPKIARDLLLFENQLPFFVLSKLFLMIENQSVQIRRFGDLALLFFHGSLPFQWNVNGSSSYSIKDTKHLLSRPHKAITPPVAKIVYEHLQVGDKFKNANFKHLLDLIHTIIRLSSLKRVVKFKKAKQRTTFAIQFSNGELEISPLRIEDETETFLRNLIAYEQYDPNKDSSYVTNYMCFMDDLIDSPKDVELLRQKGIIENWLGEDKIVSTMVNKLGHHVSLSPSKSIYVKTSIDMNKHCAKRWNVWMAKLRHNYFNSPWALLSVLAAILLLGLAITQTVFSIIN